MKRLLLRALVAVALAGAGLVLAGGPSHALDCTVETPPSRGDITVGGVGYVDLDLHSATEGSLCINTGSVGVYVEYHGLDGAGPHLDSSIEVCLFTGGVYTSCVNPVYFVNIGVNNDDLANTGASASPSNVWIEVLNGSAGSNTIRLWINSAQSFHELPGRCINVIGSSSCP